MADPIPTPSPSPYMDIDRRTKLQRWRAFPWYKKAGVICALCIAVTLGVALSPMLALYWSFHCFTEWIDGKSAL